MHPKRTRSVGADTDTIARRVTIHTEVTARAVRYASDIAPETSGERLADVIAAADALPVWAYDGDPSATTALLELAGRVQAWLEHIAADAAR